MGPNRIEASFDNFKEIILRDLKKLSPTDLSRNDKLSRLVKQFLTLQQKAESPQKPFNFRGKAEDGLRAAEQHIQNHNAINSEMTILIFEIIAEASEVFSGALISHLKLKRRKTT